MAKKIQLSIAEPCHENWEAMTPVEKGKFCGSCQKQVVDFSSMSDRQIAEFFKKPSTGSVCGRFMTDQLDRPMEIPRKRIPWLKYFFQITIPAFLVSLKASANKTQGQTRIETIARDTSKPIQRMMGMVAYPIKEKPVKQDTSIIPASKPEIFVRGEVDVKQPAKEQDCTPLIKGDILISEPIVKKEIEGIVINSKGQYVPYAKIQVGKSDKLVIADATGNFVIKRNSLNNDPELTISSLNYEVKKMIVSKHYNGKLIVELKENNIHAVPKADPETFCPQTTLGGVSMTIVDSFMVENFIADPPKPQSRTKENELFVYPNPVSAGTSVSISIKNPEEGYYQLQFIGQNGQVVRQQEIWIDEDAKLMNAEIPWVAVGNYVMVLTNKRTGKKYSEKIVIQ